MKFEFPESIKIPGCEMSVTDNLVSGKTEIKCRFSSLGISFVTSEAITYKRAGSVVDLLLTLSRNAQEYAMMNAAQIIANEKPNILIEALVNANILQPETLAILKHWNQ